MDIDDTAQFNLTRNLQTADESLLFQIVSKQAYENFAGCEGPKERRVCDKEAFSDPERGQFVASWPADPLVSASYRVASKNSPYVSAA
jgi:hypothetical protein